MTVHSTQQALQRASRWLSSGVLLLVAALALLVFGSGAFALVRGEGAWSLLDRRAFAPLTRPRLTPPPSRAPQMEGKVPEVRLDAWEDTARPSSSNKL